MCCLQCRQCWCLLAPNLGLHPLGPACMNKWHDEPNGWHASIPEMVTQSGTWDVAQECPGFGPWQYITTAACQLSIPSCSSNYSLHAPVVTSQKTHNVALGSCCRWSHCMHRTQATGVIGTVKQHPLLCCLLLLFMVLMLSMCLTQPPASQVCPTEQEGSCCLG
jgi:hypothetical protein